MTISMLTAMRSAYERQEQETRYLHAVLAHVEQIVELRLDPASIDVTAYAPRDAVAPARDEMQAAGASDDAPAEAAADAANEPEPPVAPASAVPRRVGYATRAEVLAWAVAQPGWFKRADAYAALGGGLDAIGGMLQRLARASELECRGPKSRRAYRVPPVDVAARPSAKPPRRRPCGSSDALLALIQEHAPVSSERLRELTGRSYPDIAEWGHELAVRGAVVFEGDGRACTWRPAPPRDDASEVAATIAAHPEALREDQISLITRIPSARVALACAELIDRKVVALTERDTYIVVTA